MKSPPRNDGRFERAVLRIEKTLADATAILDQADAEGREDLDAEQRAEVGIAHKPKSGDA